MSGALPSYSLILDRLYASVLEVAALEGLARALCQRFASHLVSFQVDGLPSGHLPIVHFGDTGAQVHGLIEILTNSELGNPFMEDGRAALLAKIGTGHEEGLFLPGTLERTAFYRQALVPFDIRHSLGFCLHAGPEGDVIAMTVNRSIRRGHYGERDMHFAHRLLPHLRNVYQLQQRMRLVAHASETLDAFGECLWLLDPSGRVVHANTPALALMADRSAPLRQAAHTLHATWPADGPLLETAIGRATCATARQSTALRLHDAHGQLAGFARLHPWHPAIQQNPRRVAAALFVHRQPTRAAQPACDVLRRIYGLSRAEADLACALLRHGSLMDGIQALGKSRETARSQLKALFAKVGARTQGELIGRLGCVVAQPD